MVLCDQAGDAAAMNLPNKRIGLNWNTRNWYNYPYDNFPREYTSHVIAHELAHVAGDGITDHGPAGYKYDTIKGLSDEDKENNAQGYAIMWTGMWLRFNQMGATGQAEGMMYKRWPKKTRPGRGPHMYGP
jgi:hypothetical protein